MIRDDKYLVFNREEFERWIYKINVLPEDGSKVPEPIKDAVVIRRQDLFAGPALHTYAASINIAARVGNLPQLSPIADYFHEQAIAADEEGWKVPD
jgi:hypothetical protein